MKGAPTILCALLAFAASDARAADAQQKGRSIAAAYAAADLAFTGGDLASARDLTRQLTEKFPDDPASWLRLAQIEERLGAFNEALAAYDNALDVEAAFSVDGGITLARMRYQRATLLIAEANRELAASGGMKLGAPWDAARTDLARVLAQANVLQQARPAPNARLATRAAEPARGYVVDTPQGSRPGTKEKAR